MSVSANKSDAGAGKAYSPSSFRSDERRKERPSPGGWWSPLTPPPPTPAEVGTRVETRHSVTYYERPEYYDYIGHGHGGISSEGRKLDKTSAAIVAVLFIAMMGSFAVITWRILDKD